MCARSRGAGGAPEGDQSRTPIRDDHSFRTGVHAATYTRSAVRADDEEPGVSQEMPGSSAFEPLVADHNQHHPICWTRRTPDPDEGVGVARAIHTRGGSYTPLNRFRTILQDVRCWGVSSDGDGRFAPDNLEAS